MNLATNCKNLTFTLSWVEAATPLIWLETELDLYMKRCFDVIRNITEIKEATTPVQRDSAPALGGFVKF